ncbi:MAG: TIGR00725 family protein [Candidatus Zixiibacteriota bacterium]|nr:MAG: TIGR00725 family protein [candidate division Zixibacteria bacterium]
MTAPKPVIAVIGGSICSEEQARQAETVGRLIAEHGGVVVCGGMGGIMEAVSRGAKQAGGLTVGILPTTNKHDANRFIDFAIPTGFGEARNALVVRTADAVIAFPGKYGTLSEMALALVAGKPVVSLSNWDLGDDSGVVVAKDPQEAAALAMKLATGNRA